MNEDEFAEKHLINGVEMPCTIDNNELIDREKRYQYKKSLYADGIYLKQLLIYRINNKFTRNSHNAACVVFLQESVGYGAQTTKYTI